MGIRCRNNCVDAGPQTQAPKNHQPESNQKARVQGSGFRVSGLGFRVQHGGNGREALSRVLSPRPDERPKPKPTELGNQGYN